MKLRTRIMLVFTSVILITILIMTAFGIKLIGSIFENYLMEAQNTRLQQIVSDVSLIIRENKLEITNVELMLYSKSEEVNMEIKDTDGQLVASYTSLEDPNKDTVKTSTYTLVNEQMEKIGSLDITYDVESAFLNDAVQEFQEQATFAVLAIILVNLVLSVAISYYISKRLTEPILRLSESTTKLREKDYAIDVEATSVPEISELSENLHFLAKTLEAQEQIRKEYAQDISHELRTPITNLQLQLEAIQDGIKEADEKTVATLLKNTNQLKSIVERLRDSFDESSLMADPTLENANLSDELLSTLDAFEANLNKRDIVLVRAIEENINFWTDVRLFNQLTTNLLSNAMKAVEGKEEALIRVSLTRARNFITLTITDNGVGIAPDDLSRIFERFYRVDNARTSGQGGKGLGLAITKNIVDVLGGEISVTSKLAVGTTFKVVFPVHSSNKRR